MYDGTVPLLRMPCTTDEETDDIDIAIPYALQEDARNMSSGDIAERIGISDSTGRRRIQSLESDGVIEGYSASVAYQKWGHPVRMVLYCTATIPGPGYVVPDILDIDGGVSV